MGQRCRACAPRVRKEKARARRAFPVERSRALLAFGGFLLGLLRSVVGLLGDLARRVGRGLRGVGGGGSRTGRRIVGDFARTFGGVVHRNARAIGGFAGRSCRSLGRFLRGVGGG